MKNLNLTNLCNQLIRRGSGENLNLFRYAAMVVVLLLGVGNAWASSSKTYYATMNVAVASTGGGTVYVNASGTTSQTKSASSTSSSTSISFNIYATANAGYKFTSWSGSGITFGSATTASTTGSISTSSTSSPGTSKTATASFEVIKVTAAPADVTINATDPSAIYPDAGGVVVGFTTSSSNANSDFTTGGSGDSRWTISAWPTHASATSTTFNYKFVGNGSYGTNNRTFTKTVTLKGLNDATVKTCTLTAKYPNPRVVACDAEATDLTIYPTFKVADATQEAVEKTAVFDVVYADNANNFTAAFSGATGSGTWTVTGISVDQANQKATVTYTFNGNKAVGTHTAVLTLTAANCQGWDDTSAAGGASATVTLTAENTQEATNDVSVTTAAGVTTEYATWAEGLAAANASAGSTLKLLRDVDLTGTYGITGTQGITQTMTLDLNGKTLSASTGGPILNPSKSGKTLTIKDSKTGGKIQNIADLNGALYAINVGAGVTLNVESGYIYVENQSQYAYGTSTYTDGTPNISSMQARGIHMAATSKVNISGGKIHAVASCNAFGVREESSKANNTVLTITGGEIIGEAPRYAYGIYAGGKVNISGGTVTALLNDKTVNGNTTYTANAWNDYTLHRYGYGIRMFASSNATAANCYFGTLTITGGTINAINVNATTNSSGTLQSEHTYGIYMDISATGAGAGKTAPDGTKVMKACAVGSMENATVNVTHAGNLGYGIMALGAYNSFDNKTTPFTIKNSTINVTTNKEAYGVYASAYVNWSSTLTALTGNGGCTRGEFELTNVTINATAEVASGAYCAWASCTSGTVANAKATTGSTSTGNGTYYGEYAVAGKITVNSGTFTADAKTSSAYGIGSSDRAKCVRNVNGVFANRDAAADPQGSLSNNTPTSEAYPELYIHGGNFSATTGTSTAVAVKSGGTTLIDGGTFNAFAGTSDAYGLKINSGVTTANGVTFPASATTKAYGVYITGTVSDWSLFAYAGEAILNNCNVTATTRTTTEARAVYIDGATKTYTQASFDAMKSANNNNYKNYGDYAQVGERSIMGRATINGGTYSATAETTTAYGALLAATKVSTNAIAVASGNLEIHDAKFIVKTNGTTTAIGVYAGGPTIIDGCDITVQPKTGTAKGVHAYDKKTTITNTKIDVKATTEARLFYAEAAIGSTTGWDYHGEFELGEGNECVATATGGNTAHILTLLATKRNIASGTFAGDYANATSALVTGGSYKATATGTTCYAVNLSAEQVQGDVKAAPSCTIEDGKFWAKADGGTTGICSTNGVAGNILFKGGVYNVNTTLSKHIPEGLEEVPLASDRTEYGEGYRYEVDKAGMHGIDVCQIGSTKYKSLEEALQAVTSGQTIYMIANYTMATPGDYVLPANTTLLIPYKTGSGAGATTAIGNSAKTTTSATTPSLFRKLTFGNGVNLTCFGTIETSAEQKANGQYGANVGMPSGAYGQIQMDEGSHISMESGSRLNCWGYITGKGSINVKNNATVLEGFQLGDWCGGTNATTLTGSSNKGKAFPITHYFYQSIECPITYRPGAKALGSTHVNMSFVGTVGQDAVPLVGTSDAMFIMDNVNASEDTWVMKDYDEETDYCYWTINSGASIGNLIVKIPNAIDVNSADYVLPICSNMAVVLNYGEGSIGQHAVFTPGSKLIINKEGTLVLKNVNVSMLDLTEYTGATIYRASYSPTWGTTNPRSTSVNDAEVFVHGKIELKNNGGLYTSASGANIHSTNSDAGQVLYTSAAQSDKTTYYLKSSATSATAVTVNAAKLRNEDNTYSSTGGTAAGDVWVYVNSKWTKKTKEGCFSVETTDKKHYYIQPSDIVEVNYPAQSNHTYTSVTGGRVFVWDEDCYWWEVETTPTAEGYFKAITPDHNGKYNYYYYDSSAACWKIKTITVTWNINGTTTNYSVGYGTKPEWLGATPTKTSSSSNYVWRWDGWTKGSDATVLANDDLPYVTENTTFTAHFYEKYYEYNVTFKNSDGTILESKNWIAGTTPSYEGTPTKNPTVDYTYEFNGTWSPEIATVTKSATYTAQYTATPRAYTITFLNYDMSKLGTAEVVYNGTPSNETYLAAVAPLTEDPYKPDNSAFSFEFAGWRLQGASSNGFAQVKGDQTYIAQFNQTTKKYKVSFVDDDGETVLHYLQLEYGQTPSYTWDNPANKQDVEWTYAFTGWDPSEFAVVEGAQTYTAVYNKTKRKYDITWKDGNGNTLKTDQVAYGSTPSYSGATPTKESTNTHNYTFNNTWSPAIVPVEGEATYTAQFNETERKYRVTWDANGGTCGTAYNDYSYNTAIGTLPTATKAGHTFNGWFTSATGGTQITTATKVTAEVTYHAHFTINSHTLTWDANGGNIYGSYTSGTVTYGTAISAPNTPTKTNYVFNGWHDGTSIVTPASTMPDNDLTYTAQWTAAEASVTVEGGDPTFYATIAEAITAAHGMTNPTVKILKEEVTIPSEITISSAMTIDLNGNKIISKLASATGVFKINASDKTITIKDSGTGGKIDHTASTSGNNYLYGINVTAGSLSIESGTIYAENTGASRAYGINTATNAKLVTVSGSAIIEAKSSSAFGIYTNNSCNLTMTGGTFTASGSESRGIYTKGTTELTNATITASGSDSRTIFAKDGNMTIHSGTYSATGTGSVYVIFFEAGTVTVKGGKFNGSTCEIAKRNTAYNVVLKGGVYVHETDLKAKCAANYNVKALTETHPEYANGYRYIVDNLYTVTWKLDDETIRIDEVAYEDKPYYSEAPTKDPTPQNTFEFTGWSDGTNTYAADKLPAVTKSVTYTAQFMNHRRYYTIIWKNYDGTVLETDEGEKGEMYYSAQPSYGGATPTKVLNDKRTYTFKGWTDDGENTYALEELPTVSKDKIYTAVFSMSIIATENDNIEVTTNEETVTTTVQVSGKVSVAENKTLSTDDLILEATPTSSGEITGKGTVTAKRAYFDFSNGTNGFKAKTWYAVAVPWKVAVPAYDTENTGVYITNDGENYTQQELGHSFDLIYYDGALRAEKGHSNACWKYIEDDDADNQIMYPGRAYMIYLTADAKTIRFERKEGADLQTTTLAVATYTLGTGNNKDANWNGIANPATYHAYINANAKDYTTGTMNVGQVYNAETKTYSVVDMDANNLVVGQPIFVQATEANESVVAYAAHNDAFHAPRRARAQATPQTRYELKFAPSEEEVTDRVIVRMIEDKEKDAYIVGQDLVKMGVSNLVPQMWIDRYDSKMCINTVAPINNTADYPLGISVQKDGEYDMFIDNQPDDNTMLYLTYDGEAIWNLSYGGYVASLNKGTNNHYGLRIVYSAPKITTGIEEATIQNGEAIRKVIVDDKVYIIRNGEIYSVTGQKTK